ncbi:MAG TPA: 50S ribosomal protein L20 [Candidatus Paceibacterota bacterium]|mgnify:FL=1|jgi:large subunit ribosomal protein L20|nr:50S ribosomal protein L20 [Bacteroidia bacterium]HQV65051.1 50S ribosomal protein L20 [Candidatus Paceibacterota bacterium]
MTRVKRGVISAKRRRNVLADAKGYRHQRSTTERAAKVAIIKAGVYAFTHRKDKKNDMRRLWTIRMNAALRPLGVTYSKFINMLKVKNITLDRKVLSEIARTNPTAFAQIVEQVK